MTSRRAFIQSVLAAGASIVPASGAFGGSQGRTPMPRVIVCDVNETLLDVGALEPVVFHYSAYSKITPPIHRS